MSLHFIPLSKELVKIVVTNSPSRLAALYHTDPPSSMDHTRFYPENHMNGNEMRNYAVEVKPGVVIVTGSLFLFREFMLSRRRDLMFASVQFNDKLDHPVITCSQHAEVVELEILDRELEQSQRYMDAQSEPVEASKPAPPSLFECSNCGYRPTTQEVWHHQGDCPKCCDTVHAFTMDVAEALLKAGRSKALSTPHP